jgi:hypothetical protein
MWCALLRQDGKRSGLEASQVRCDVFESIALKLLQGVCSSLLFSSLPLGALLLGRSA